MALFLLTYGYNETDLRAQRRDDHVAYLKKLREEGALVAAVPDVMFVLVHAGMLTDREPDTVRVWRDGMARLAALPNIVVKLTGQGTFTRRLDPDLIAFVAEETLGWFGAERAMFGTNFPVEKLWTDIPSLVEAWRAAVPESDHAAVFAGTARRVYALPE